MRNTLNWLKYISLVTRNNNCRRSSKIPALFGVRHMSSDHLERTASNTRHNVVSRATVVKVKDESSTVKQLSLKVHDKNFFFKAGQWVDMMMPNVEKVGGFSMCSSPQRLVDDGLLDLAVKRSDHPPALWVHTKCKEGVEVNIRSGGDTFYDPKPTDPSTDLLLIAGGIGINPLYSILCHVRDLLQMKEERKGDNSTGTDNSVYIPGNIHLLYSASSEEELIFQRELCEVSERFPCIECQYFVTRQPDLPTSTHIKNHRINQADIEDSLKRLRKKKTVVYICGPSPMIETMETMLQESGIDKHSIQYEKWW